MRWTWTLVCPLRSSRRPWRPKAHGGELRSGATALTARVEGRRWRGGGEGQAKNKMTWRFFLLAQSSLAHESIACGSAPRRRCSEMGEGSCAPRTDGWCCRHMVSSTNTATARFSSCFRGLCPGASFIIPRLTSHPRNPLLGCGRLVI